MDTLTILLALATVGIPALATTGFRHAARVRSPGSRIAGGEILPPLKARPLD